MNKAYTQHDREQLLTSLLDITLDQFHAKLPDLDIDSLPEEVYDYTGKYFSSMTEAANDPQGPHAQLMMQAIAAMSDSTLHQIVKLFSTDPLN